MRDGRRQPVLGQRRGDGDADRVRGRRRGERSPGAGNANPDSNFRFYPALGGTGGYIFNLKTTGLATGSYKLFFTLTGDPTVHDLPFVVR